MPHRLTTAIWLLVLTSLLSEVRSAEIHVNGLPPAQKEELIARLTPRLDFVTRREPSPWRADDAAFFLQRLLIRSGHAEAIVDWNLPGGQVIELNVRPGVRYLYGDISADRLGPLSQESLENYFLQPLVDTEFVKQEEAPYIAEYTERGATNVENYLKSQGYWAARVNASDERYDRKQKRVHISLELNEGPLHQLSIPVFHGVSGSDLQAHRAELQPFVGQTANTENITKIRTLIEEYYRKRGYHFAQITMRSQHRGHFTRLVFNIDSGERYRVRDVVVSGDEKTKSRRIRRYFDRLKGEYYDENNSDSSLKKLLATGAFRTVTVTPVATPDAMLDLQVNVEEAKAKSIRAYTGFGSYEGGILGLAYTDMNFGGDLLRLNARGEYSGRGFLGETSLTEPYFLGEPLNLTVRAFTLQRLYGAYDKLETGGEISVSWTPNDEYSTRLYLGGSYVSTTTSSLTPAELGPDDYVHTRLGIEQSIDFRDNTTLPSKGFHGTLRLETGALAGDETTSYVLADLEASYRIRHGEKNHFLTRFATGAIMPADSELLPIDARMFSGGADSVRSFPERELGPRSLTGGPIGGEAYWNFTTQYVRDINDPIKAVVFFDMGQVYQEASSWGFNDPSYAIGAGLRIDLPIGPIRLEYGHNLNRRKGEPAGTLHFAIGASF